MNRILLDKKHLFFRVNALCFIPVALLILLFSSKVTCEEETFFSDEFFDEEEFLSDSSSQGEKTEKDLDPDSEPVYEQNSKKENPGAIKKNTETLKPAKKIKFDTLCGKLPKVVEGNTIYVVTCDLIVPSNRLVTVEKGAVFLFKNFTGIHVEGKLHCKGTKKHPIVFTSLRDPDYNPYTAQIANPYDWNGIVVHKDAFGTLFEYIKLQYSVYGLVTRTKFIKIDPGIFRNNGESDVVKNEKKIKVNDNPYKYILSLKDAKVDGVRVNLLKDPMAPRRNIMRYTGLAAFLGGGILGVLQTREYLSAQENYKKSAKTTIENLQNGSSDEFEKHEERVKETGAISIAGYGTALLGALGFGLSFTF